jgi:phosphoribosylformylglycinamidine cyclo-ligase
LLDGGVAVHYAVHVTGHGWRKLMRANLPLTYVVERLPPVPPVLAYLMQASGMDVAEAYGTFNMGAGFAFYVAPESAEAAQEIAQAVGAPLLHAGHVSAGPKRVVLESLGVTFEGESLAIR